MSRLKPLEFLSRNAALAGPLALLLAAIPALAAEPLPATPLPPAVAAMIDAAAANDALLGSVADLAKKTNPGAAAEIDARVANLRHSTKAAQMAKLAEQPLFGGIKGTGEAGFNTSTGNTRSTGLALGITASKETRRWKHGFKASLDYQRDNGITSKDHLFAGYEGGYKFSEHFYALLLFNWEHDSFAGYDSRFTQSLGLGYKVIDRPKLQLGVEAGPAVRETHYESRRYDPSLAWRLGTNASWTLNPAITITQTAAAYLEDENNTLSSTTALTTKITGALSARASYVVQYESDPPVGLRRTDTTTRLTLVYAF